LAGWVLACSSLGLVAFLSAQGCGPSGASICDRVCDCVGCSDSERDDCLDAFDDAERESADQGCQAEYDDYVACIDDDLKCDDEEAVADDCGEDAEDLADCLDVDVTPGLGGLGDPCDTLRSQCQACGESTQICLDSVDLIDEIGGTDACQEAVDAGGVQCSAGTGGGSPGGSSGG
jgi:hypothetical protein